MAPRLSSAARTLRARTLALVAYGEIGSSLIFALGIVAVYAVGLTPWVLLAVGVLMLVVTLSYAEGAAAMPEAGGAAAFVRRAFSDPLGFATGWLLFLDYLVVIALAALVVPSTLAEGFDWPALTERPWDAVVAILAIAALAGVRRVRRVRLWAVAAVAAAISLAVQAGIAVLGFALVFTTDGLTVGMDVGRAPSWGSIALALSLATLAYTGLETVANFAAEVREPGRDLPRGLFLGIAAVVVVHVAVSMVGVTAYPTHPDPAGRDGVASDLGTDWLQAPLVGIAHAVGDQLPGGGGWLVGLIAVTNALILIAAIATSMAGGERLAYAMARYDMLPHAFARPERGGAPAGAASLAAAVLAPLLIVIADAAGSPLLFLAGLYSFGVLIAMTAAQAAVVRLRVTEPGLERPFRVPLGVRVRGHVVPLPAVIGGVLTLALWIASLSTHGGAAIAGPAWLAVGAVVYLVSRRAGGETLLGRATPAVPDLVPDSFPEPPSRILVPLKLADIGEEVLATALRLAEERTAEVRVLHVLRVPMSQPLDAPIEGGGEEAAREAMEEVREIAAEQGVSVVPVIVRARSLSEAIVAEAEASGADLIVMGSAARWRPKRRFFSPTVDGVLRRARCEVMVVTYPPGVLDGSESA